ncbi:MAG: hypothetical protein ACQESP_12895 [Candidatus Muiribacteriota bacterium]
MYIEIFESLSKAGEVIEHINSSKRQVQKIENNDLIREFNKDGKVIRKLQKGHSLTKFFNYERILKYDENNNLISELENHYKINNQGEYIYEDFSGIKTPFEKKFYKNPHPEGYIIEMKIDDKIYNEKVFDKKDRILKERNLFNTDGKEILSIYNYKKDTIKVYENGNLIKKFYYSKMPGSNVYLRHIYFPKQYNREEGDNKLYLYYEKRIKRKREGEFFKIETFDLTFENPDSISPFDESEHIFHTVKYIKKNLIQKKYEYQKLKIHPEEYKNIKLMFGEDINEEDFRESDSEMFFNYQYFFDEYDNFVEYNLYEGDDSLLERKFRKIEYFD